MRMKQNNITKTTEHNANKTHKNDTTKTKEKQEEQIQ